MEYPYILNIQKFSVHDGPGIRTTVFFKGCPLRCIWCHNPESQRYEQELLFDREKCTGCGCCEKGCKNGAISVEPWEEEILEHCKENDRKEKMGQKDREKSDNRISSKKAITEKNKCNLCGICEDYCPGNNREVAGKQYEIQELVKILLQDQVFYEQSGGGVTLSGGEVMTQNMDYVENLCRELKKHHISVGIDTCGYAARENFERLLPYVDFFLYDIKMINEKKHKVYTGVGNERILSNLEYLALQNANLNIRIPVIQSVNEEEKDMLEIISYMKEKIGNPKVNLLPYHNTGSGKYAKLAREYEGKHFTVPDEEKMKQLKKIFEENGLTDVKIGG